MQAGGALSLYVIPTISIIITNWNILNDETQQNTSNVILKISLQRRGSVF